MGWESIKLDDGKKVQMYKQEFEQECGPACVATICRLLGFSTDIAQARTWVGKEDCNKPPGAWKDGVHDFSKDWSYMTSLTQALVRAGVNGAKTFRKTETDYQKFCQSREKKSPAILRLEYHDFSGHFVVTVGKNGNKNRDFIEILDPYYGYQQVQLSTFPNYLGIGELDQNWSVATVKW